EGRSGISAIAQLRDAFGAPIPAFLLSGDTAPERLREARERGYHLLHKPIRPMRLRAMVSQLLQEPEAAGAAGSDPRGSIERLRREGGPHRNAEQPST